MKTIRIFGMNLSKPYPDNDPVLVHGFSAEDLKDIFQCSAQDAYLYLLRMETDMILTQYVKEQADDDLL